MELLKKLAASEAASNAQQDDGVLRPSARAVEAAAKWRAWKRPAEMHAGLQRPVESAAYNTYIDGKRVHQGSLMRPPTSRFEKIMNAILVPGRHLPITGGLNWKDGDLALYGRALWDPAVTPMGFSRPKHQMVVPTDRSYWQTPTTFEGVKGEYLEFKRQQASRAAAGRPTM